MRKVIVGLGVIVSGQWLVYVYINESWQSVYSCIVSLSCVKYCQNIITFFGSGQNIITVHIHTITNFFCVYYIHYFDHLFKQYILNINFKIYNIQYIRNII